MAGPAPPCRGGGATSPAPASGTTPLPLGPASQSRCSVPLPTMARHLLVLAAAFVLAATTISTASAAVPVVQTVSLQSPGGPVQMPMIGLGTAGLGGWGNSNASVAAITLWLKNGGRAIHGAWMYCNLESIGTAIKQSGVDRKELFVMNMLPQWHLGYNETMANFNDGLQQLGLEYVDLYMFHWPGMYENQLPMMAAKHPEVCGKSILEVPPCKKGQPSWKQCRLDSWRAMTELQKAGKIRAL
jgi:diketogulonate reductase-like aldo/keto reductase